MPEVFLQDRQMELGIDLQWLQKAHLHPFPSWQKQGQQTHHLNQDRGQSNVLPQEYLQLAGRFY